MNGKGIAAVISILAISALIGVLGYLLSELESAKRDLEKKREGS